MSFPIKHSATNLKAISTKNRSLLLTGRLDREKGLFGEFKPKSTPVPDTYNPASSQFIALYDEKGNLKWIKDLYDEFNIKQPSVHLQEDGNIKIVGRLSGTENIGDMSIASIDENDAYIATINANGRLTKAEVIRTTNRNDAPKLIFAPDNSYYSLSSHLDSDDQDIVLRKFNSSHQLEWQKTGDTLGLSTIISYEQGNQSAFTQQDNSLTFEQYKGGTFGNPSTRHIGKVSSRGDLEWKIEIDHIGSISPSIDGGAIFLQSNGNNDIHEESITKLDSSGKRNWVSYFSRNDRDGNLEIEEKKNGNIVIAGEFGEEAKFGRDLKLTADDGATFIAQLDNNGNFTNAQKIGNEGWGTVSGLTNLSQNETIISRNGYQNSWHPAILKFDNNLNKITTQGESETPRDSKSQPKNGLSAPKKYKIKFIDKITNFNPSTDTLEIDTDSFGIDSSATFAVGRNKKVVKKQLTKQDFDFLYDQKKGGLYFNENGSDKGFGDGGIIAILKGAPDLTIDNIEFL